MRPCRRCSSSVDPWWARASLVQLSASCWAGRRVAWRGARRGAAVLVPEARGRSRRAARSPALVASDLDPLSPLSRARLAQRARMAWPTVPKSSLANAPCSFERQRCGEASPSCAPRTASASLCSLSTRFSTTTRLSAAFLLRALLFMLLERILATPAALRELLGLSVADARRAALGKRFTLSSRLVRPFSLVQSQQTRLYKTWTSRRSGSCCVESPRRLAPLARLSSAAVRLSLCECL